MAMKDGLVPGAVTIDFRQAQVMCDHEHAEKRPIVGDDIEGGIRIMVGPTRLVEVLIAVPNHNSKAKSYTHVSLSLTATDTRLLATSLRELGQFASDNEQD